MSQNSGHPQNAELRQRLTEITSTFVGKKVDKQIDLIRDLRVLFDHQIELSSCAVAGKPETFAYNCFQFALEMVGPPRLVVDIATLYPDVYPNSEFMQHLMDHALTERTGDMTSGDVVVYLREGRPAHAGHVVNGRIRSKWGTAHLWTHGLFEVPDTYGHDVRFFHRISREDSLYSFVRWAETMTGQAFFPSHH